jgi:hypothetical protein
MLLLCKKYAVCLVGLALVLVSVTPSLAGVTGKISGKVVDSETGMELPGASVRINGTTMGNMAGADGSYFILNVPPEPPR